ncbi:MAG TPA: NAD(P)/FAD-dependent oxidoreductase [Bacillota bacterium]|nr:NAD(P)/FAD-dependent oxidoreductase [Bacillota bacterium]
MKKIVIIGAGISGLATGCYAQMNGYDTEIFEMHNLPGGVCTSWQRGNYLFDHCLHWVLGSNQGNSLFPLFEELGIVPAIEFYHTERFRKIEAGGKTLVVYTNLDRLENEFLKLFPREAKAIRKMMKMVRFYTKFRPPMDADFGQFGLADIVKMIPYLPSFFKLTHTTIEEYLRMFHDNEFQEMLFHMFPVKNLPALMVIMPLAYFHNHEGGYPLGGSLHFARTIESRYLGLGGKISYQQKIKRIMIRDHQAIGIETVDGRQIEADIVISACDGRTVLYDMLEGKYLTPEIAKLYKNPSLWPPLISISLGVNRDLSEEVELNGFKLEKPVLIGNNEVDWLFFCHYCQDPAFAPPGKSVVKMQVDTDFFYWKALSANKTKYQAEKQKVLEICIGELEKRLPGIKEQIEIADIATPVTWERYTGNWQGSYEGWLPTIDLFGKFLPKELTGLKNFYMTGQWVFPGGGVPMCMSQARRLIKYICKKESRKFRAPERKIFSDSGKFDGKGRKITN